MNGMTSTLFRSTYSVNRAMMVTTLYRMSGSTEQIEPYGFTDVPEGSFYYYAVGWGQAYGIVNGTSASTFDPETTITRQQFMTFLYRYAHEYLGMSYVLPTPNIISKFNDYSSIVDFTKSASNWCVNCGLYPSYATNFYPNETVTRGMCADYLYKFNMLACGDAKVFESEDFLDYTVCSEICNYISSSNDIYYDVTSLSGLTPLAVQFAFYNSSLIYSSSHGEDDRLILKNGELIYSDIAIGSMEHVDLVYLSSCKSGGTFAEYLHDTAGAQAVVGFTEMVLATSTNNGICLFDKRFFESYSNGNSAYDAAVYALEGFSDFEKSAKGVSSCVVYD